LTDDPAFEQFPERRRVLINFMEQAARERGDPSTYGRKFFHLFERIHAPEGDANRLTDPGELYRYAGADRGLTVAGMEKLRQEIYGRRGSPDAIAETALKQNFIKLARSEINPLAQEAFGLPGDRQDEENFQRFFALFSREYDQGRKAGKMPATMLDPDSAD